MQLNRLSASEQIFQDIVKKIRRREILPGQKLVIKTIQDTYSVSSTPVRDALNKLYHFGFVDLKCSATANVIAMTETEQYQLVDLNEELLRMSFRLMMNNGTISQMREKMEPFYQKELELVGNTAAKRLKAFLDFAEVPSNMTGNAFYSDMTDVLYGKTMVAFGDCTDVFEPDEAMENSRKMMEALQEEDWERFQLLRFYMTDGFRRYLDRFRT